MVSGPYAWIQITSPMVVATDTSFVGSKFQMVEAMTYVQEWTAKYGWSYVPNTLEGWGAQGTQSNSVFEFPTTNSLYLARGTATQPRYYRVIYRAIWHPGALWLPLPVGGADTYDTTKVLGWGDFVSQPNDYSSGVGYCSF